MNLRLAPCLAALAALWLTAASSAWAAPVILLDDFSSPAPAQSVLGVESAYTTSTNGVFAGQAGQARDAVYFLTENPDSTGALATIGDGVATVKDGLGAAGVYFLAYGSWAVNLATPGIQGPALDLDLSSYHDFQAVFSQVDEGLNLNVVFYTSQPLDQPGAVYYTGPAANLLPVAPGGPLTANLSFNDAADDNFNFHHVDGIFFEIDGGGRYPDNAYSLTRLSIASVPEPQSCALLLLGLATLMLIKWRRAALV